MSKFKVGDKVKILSNAIGGDNIGDVFKIERFNISPLSGTIFYYNDKNTMYREDEIELVEELFTKGETVLDEYDDEVEFIYDMGEEDKYGDRYVVRDKDYYFFSSSVTKLPIKEETIEIAGKKYSKKEFEEATAKLKEIK